jgi:hypothetical protein
LALDVLLGGDASVRDFLSKVVVISFVDLCVRCGEVGDGATSFHCSEQAVATAGKPFQLDHAATNVSTGGPPEQTSSSTRPAATRCSQIKTEEVAGAERTQHGLGTASNHLVCRGYADREGDQMLSVQHRYPGR